MRLFTSVRFPSDIGFPMKPLSEQLTAVSRPRLVLTRLNERVQRLRIRLAEKAETIQALNGKVRDLEVSRTFWRNQAETLTASSAVQMGSDVSLSQSMELSVKKNSR